MKKIVIASDHAAFDLKGAMIEKLHEYGCETVDVGCYKKASCDYPVYAEKACRTLLDGEGDLCVLLCGTGVGMSLAANKIKGIRAAACSDTYTAEYTRRHNDANVLCMGARVVGEGLAWGIIKIFIESEFEGGKHARRVAMIKDIEDKQ